MAFYASFNEFYQSKTQDDPFRSLWLPYATLKDAQIGLLIDDDYLKDKKIPYSLQDDYVLLTIIHDFELIEIDRPGTPLITKSIWPQINANSSESEKIFIESLKSYWNNLKREYSKFDTFKLQKSETIANYIERALARIKNDLASLPAETQPATGNEAGAEDLTEQQKDLKPIYEAAFQAYKVAEKSLSAKCTDKQAYDWLKDNAIADYDLPAFETWAKYVRKARKYYGDSKNTPRGGRTGLSVKSSNDINLSEITNQFKKEKTD